MKIQKTNNQKQPLTDFFSTMKLKQMKKREFSLDDSEDESISRKLCVWNFTNCHIFHILVFDKL